MSRSYAGIGTFLAIKISPKLHIHFLKQRGKEGSCKISCKMLNPCYIIFLFCPHPHPPVSAPCFPRSYLLSSFRCVRDYVEKCNAVNAQRRRKIKERKCWLHKLVIWQLQSYPFAAF